MNSGMRSLYFYSSGSRGCIEEGPPKDLKLLSKG
jgi:hypothetical protein